MPQIRVTFQFKDRSAARQSGWSESYYSVNGATLDQVHESATELAIARANLLGAGVELFRIRVNDDQIPGASRPYAGLPLPAGQAYNPAYGTLHSGVKYPDYGYSALLCNVFGSVSTASRRLWISGVPDDLQLDVNDKVIDPAWIQLFNAFKNKLTGGNWGYLGLVRDPVANPTKQIQNITLNPDGSYKITINGHALQSNDKVLVSKVRGIPPGPRGNFYVDVQDANNFTLRNTLTNGYTYLGGGVVRKQYKAISAFSDLQQVHFASKKRGAPADKLRGRRRRR